VVASLLVKMLLAGANGSIGAMKNETGRVAEVV